ncbi:MAG: phenylalanine--tRNA ligase subunit beta [Enterovibrio sp.]
MKFSESWLREWVNPALSTEELAHQLTMIGLEVDAQDPVAGDFNDVVIGHVVECAQHPDADKLRVTKVDVGGEALLDIVCGAPNCRQGLKVAVAVVGAVLPGDFKIKAAKLRGQPSHGMLCSFSELGISCDSAGIIELDSDAPIGTSLRSYLQLDDYSIDLNVTANRADCLSLRGIAREIAVLNQLPMNVPTIAPVAACEKTPVAVTIADKAACPRYACRAIKDVNIKAATPLWMQEKLRRCGIRSIDPIVDITNYVMLELGQPMHAFDLEKISGNICVRTANEQEPLTLLDGRTVALTSNTLVIADDEKALAMAGIFGGQTSAVSETTQHVLLESACFDPDAIRGRARVYGLHTDSSHRFERGVDPQLQRDALERATALILEICGGTPATIVESNAQDEQQTPTITLRREKLDALLGYHIATPQVEQILTALGCKIASTESGWQAQAPSWRFDLTIEEDLIEEVARFFGYDNIPMQAPYADLKINAAPEADIALKRVRDLLVARGFYEAITYSFVEPNLQRFIVPDIKPLILPNPISVEMSAMRLSLWPGLLNTVAYNQKRQQPHLRLFESGLRFIPDPTAENGIRQQPMLAGVLTGNFAEHWDMRSKAADFFDLKADVEAILLLCSDQKRYRFEAGQHPALHPGQTAAIYADDKLIGYLGTLHPELERKFELNGNTFVFELEWDAINSRKLPQINAISKFPANRRDIAVVVHEKVYADHVVKACLQTESALIKGAELFDLYAGNNIDAGKKSLAIALNLQSNERTLEEEEITQAVDNVVKHLQEHFGAVLRD